MAQTQRTTTEVFSLLADNTSGLISPTDVRDGFETWRMGHGQLYVENGNGSPVTVAVAGTFYEMIQSTWTPSTGLHLFDESAGNGRLTYIGVADVVVHVAASISFTAGQNNITTRFRLGKNSTPDPAAEAQRKIGTGSDVGSTAIHLVTTLSTGDHVSLWATTIGTPSTITLACANLQAITMPT